MHLRLARTVRRDEMRISWTSLSADGLSVQWGTTLGNMTHSTAAINTSTYTGADLCGEPARTLGFWDPGLMHTAVIGPLDAAHGYQPGSSTVYYTVGSGGETAASFFQVPAVGPDVTLNAVLTADMGATAVDKTSQHWAEPDAYATTANMYARVVNASGFGGRGDALQANVEEQRRLRYGAAGSAQTNPTHSNAFGCSSSSHSCSGSRGAAELAFCVGDLSYATGYLGKWETFMTAIEPVSSHVPYMTGQGNHEQDWPGTGTFATGSPLNGRDSGGECGVPTQQRFVMPTDTSDNGGGSDRPIPNPTAWAVPTWYSFDQGPVHFVMVNTELGTFDSGVKRLISNHTSKTNNSMSNVSSYGWYPGDDQFAWLKADLSGVDRAITPWIIVMGHRPSFGAHPPSTASHPNVFEMLLYDAKVDVTVAGHVHYAELSCPFYQGHCLNATMPGGYDAPIHIVAGNGGQGLNNASAPSEHFPYTGSGTTRPGTWPILVTSIAFLSWLNFFFVSSSILPSSADVCNAGDAY